MKNPAPVQNPLRAEAKRLRLKKRFAQNFLVDPTVLDAIAAVVAATAGETVLEIGAGSGFLTERLIQTAGQVVAVELERRMAAYLREKFAGVPNLRLVEQDILKYQAGDIAAETFKVVGNLPYNLTSPILFHLIGELHASEHPLRGRIRQATIMVQKEVGERLAATPGSKRFNALSIAAQYWCDVTLNFEVPRAAFYPSPKVDSAVITLVPRTVPRVVVTDPGLFSRLVREAFRQRRKILKNALSGMIEADVLDRMFSQVAAAQGESDIQSRRPEALSIETCGALANAYVACTRQA